MPSFRSIRPLIMFALAVILAFYIIAGILGVLWDAPEDTRKQVTSLLILSVGIPAILIYASKEESE